MGRKAREYLPLFTLGVTTISTQIIFLRKFLDVFYGNELIIGIILANWMVLTGLGAWLAAKFKGTQNSLRLHSLGFILLGLLPAFTVAGIVAGRVCLFPSGSTTGLYPLFFFSLIIQSPYCLVSGWLFPSLTGKINSQSDFIVSRAYLFESLGAFIGVLIFNILLLFYLPLFAVIFLLFAINLYQSWDIIKPLRQKKTIYYYLGLLCFFALSGFLKPEQKLRELFYRGQLVLESRESPYGNLVVTESSGQTNFYENGLPLFAENDPVSREESVHYAMLQHSFPKKVLLISGGISGQLGEILKYPVENVDYLELNPWVLQLGAIHKLLPSDPRIHIYQADARLWLKNCNEHYDIVLLQLPDPVTANVNRYFTHEFFRALLKNLTPDAVVCLSLRSTADYMNPIARNINSLVFNSLTYSFKNVILIPGGRNYFLASDADLTVKVASLAEKRGIATQYVNQDYLQDELLSKRSEGIIKKLDKTVSLNRDFQPRVYFEETKLWLSAFKTPWWIPAILLALLLGLYFFRITKPQISLFVTGFTASSISFLLMMGYQALFGYLYLTSGLIISIFMLGLALGSLLHPWLWNKGYAPSPAWNQVYLGGFVILFLMVLLGNKSITESGTILTIIFLVLSMLNGILTGLQFSAVTTMSEEKPGLVASKIYSADLLGSSLGMLAVSALLFPLAGMVWVCLGLGLLNFILGFIMFE
ncbi:MAG: hypothetical protein AB9842_11460 [Bacteroidales bacterium]